MISSDNNCKSIRFTVRSDDRLSQLARKIGRTKRQLVADMIDYFYKSKKDPADLSDELLKRELSSGINRIISFIKTQETDLLIPMYSELNSLKTSTDKQGELSQDISRRFPLLQDCSDKADVELGAINSKLDDMISITSNQKNLKVNFLKLFDEYTAQRESLGWSSSASKREELIAKFRAAIYAL